MVRLNPFILLVFFFFKADFNSTMVRLNRAAVENLHGREYYFNSTMVRLNLYFMVLLAMRHFDFNSTMVRLNRTRYEAYQKAIQRFQFHYG